MTGAKQVNKTGTGREGALLARSTSGSKTAPLYTGFAVVLLFRSCLLLWISWEEKRLRLEDKYEELKKLNFSISCTGFPVTNQKQGKVCLTAASTEASTPLKGKYGGLTTLTSQKARPHCPMVQLSMTEGSQ
jgi:hypothetical protein